MDQLEFGGKIYISSKRAAQISGYAKDYIGQLCRADKLDCKLVGRTWYVREESIYSHKRGTAEGVSADEAPLDNTLEAVEEMPEEVDPGIASEETPVAIRTANAATHGHHGAYTAVKDAEKPRTSNLVQTRSRSEAEISGKTFVHRIERPVSDAEPEIAQDPMNTHSAVSTVALVGFVMLVAVATFAGSLSLEHVLSYTSHGPAQMGSAIQVNPVYVQESLSGGLEALIIGFDGLR